MSRNTTAAYDLAGAPEAYPDAGAAWQPVRLFYTAIPTSTFDTLREQMEAMGLDTSIFDRSSAMRRSFTDDEITTVLDVSAELEAKFAAFECHRTQHNPDGLFRRIPEELMREMMAREYYAQVRPAPDAGAARSDDLFSGMPVQ